MKIGQDEIVVSRVGLGGNTFGWTSPAAESFEVLDGYVAAGGNFIDTSDAYSFWSDGNSGGESETIIGDWLTRRGRRDDVYIATKVGALPELKGLAPDTIRTAVDQSLARLKTDYIDLYYAHIDDETVPVAEVLGAFGELVAQGKVRSIGASNFSADRLAESLAASDAGGLPRYVALQNKYNLLARDFEGELSELCAQEAIVCVPYQALASGVLTGKYSGGEAGDSPSPRATHALAAMGEPRTGAVLDALARIAEDRGVAVASVSIAWLAGKPTVGSALASARNVEQLTDLIAAQELVLTAAEMAELDGVSAA